MNRPLNHPLRPAQVDDRARFNAGEFMRMASSGAFDDMKVELIGGELHRMNPPMNEHASLQAQLLIRLARLVPEARLRGEVGIRLGGDTVVGADAVLLDGDVTDRSLLEPGDILLVAEIASTTIVRDTGAKRLAYAAAAIPHYWVIDIERRVTHVYAEPVAGDYADVSTTRFGSPLAVPGTDRAITLG